MFSGSKDAWCFFGGPHDVPVAVAVAVKCIWYDVLIAVWCNRGEHEVTSFLLDGGRSPTLNTACVARSNATLGIKMCVVFTFLHPGITLYCTGVLLMFCWPFSLYRAGVLHDQKLCIFG